MTTRPQASNPIWASIDIGSNSFRLELAHLSGDRYQRVSYTKESVRLGAGLDANGMTGATVANGICLAAARTGTLLKAGWDPDADGLFGAPPVHVLIGADAHSSLFSSLQLIGFGYNRVIKIATDGEGRMQPASLEAAIAPLSGPKIVIAQAGQINTGAYDPFIEIARIAKAHGAWLHVDGAFGLWAAADPSRRHLVAGLERADSWATDAHKWLNVPYDSGLVFVAHPAAHAAQRFVAPSTPRGAADPAVAR